LKNRLREKLYAGETSFGTWITIANPDVVDILKHLDFDWFVFDTEHSDFGTNDVKTMLQALGDKVSSMVRIGQVDQYLVKRALDIGSQGILAPLVNSPEEAERVVSYAMYPPEGTRGAGPGRAADYGMNLGEYISTANKELLIAVQIETKQALSRVDEILSTKRVDIGFVGPSDLTISLGFGMDRANPKITEAMERVVKSCNDHGKIPGTLAISPEEALKWAKIGFRFISLASDARFLTAGARSYLSVKGSK
jgi:2-keto-3-deoxy-L-rhamnonate aldolase RhmA